MSPYIVENSSRWCLPHMTYRSAESSEEQVSVGPEERDGIGEVIGITLPGDSIAVIAPIGEFSSGLVVSSGLLIGNSMSGISAPIDITGCKVSVIGADTMDEAVACIGDCTGLSVEVIGTSAVDTDASDVLDEVMVGTDGAIEATMDCFGLSVGDMTELIGCSMFVDFIGAIV